MAKKRKVKKTKAKSKSRKKKGGIGSLGVLIIAIAVIGLVVIFSRLKAGEPVKYIKADKTGEWGVAGEKIGQLSSPRGIALSPDGKFVYVCSLNSSTIGKFKPDGEFVSGWGGKGKTNGLFNEPSGMSTDKDGNVFVADAWNGRIQKFDPKGKFLLEIGGTKAGFYSPRNVGVNKYGIVVVADTGTSRLHRFDVDGNRIGNPIGGQGRALGKFNEVFGIAFDSKGRIYAADTGNRRVQVFSADLQPIGQIHVKGWDQAFPLWPMLAVDSRDYLYVVSNGTQEIIVYDTKQKNFKYVGTIKTDMRDKLLFTNPLSIAIDPSDTVYVTELSRNKVITIRPEFGQ
jgi:sugar lactone lactonase YvrE